MCFCGCWRDLCSVTGFLYLARTAHPCLHIKLHNKGTRATRHEGTQAIDLQRWTKKQEQVFTRIQNLTGMPCSYLCKGIHYSSLLRGAERWFSFLFLVTLFSPAHLGRCIQVLNCSALYWHFISACSWFGLSSWCHWGLQLGEADSLRQCERVVFLRHDFFSYAGVHSCSVYGDCRVVLCTVFHS